LKQAIRITSFALNPLAGIVEPSKYFPKDAPLGIDTCMSPVKSKEPPKPLLDVISCGVNPFIPEANRYTLFVSMAEQIWPGYAAALPDAKTFKSLKVLNPSFTKISTQGSSFSGRFPKQETPSVKFPVPTTYPSCNEDSSSKSA